MTRKGELCDQHAVALVWLLAEELIVMKITSIAVPIVFLLVCVTHGLASTYYISSSGNDDNNGLSESTPWRTVDKVNTIWGDGNTFLFKCGDTFCGEVTANGSELTYGAYGVGDRPVIKGSVAITNWSWDATHNCYVAPATNDIHHLFVEGELMTIARYPNTNAADLGWLQTDSASSKNTFCDAALGAYGKPDGYWAGATLRIRSCSWLFEIRTVTNSTSAGTISFATNLTETGGSTICPGWGYYLDNVLGELDYENEWYCDTVNDKVYLMTPGNVDPNTLLVEGMCFFHGIRMDWEKENMSVEGLAFEHQIDGGVETVFTDGAMIRDCHFSKCEVSGVMIDYGCANITVENNVFEDMLNIGIKKMANESNATVATLIQSNIVLRTGLRAGYGQGYCQESSGIRCLGPGATIRRNRIEDVGYVGIVLNGGNHVCEENIIRNAQLLLDDGGTIDIASSGNTVQRNLIFDTYGNRDISNGQLENGHVHGRMGFCIFTQPHDCNNVITENTLVDNTGGILIDTTTNTMVMSNVVYNTTSEYIPFHITLSAYEGPTGMGDMIVHNVFYSLSSNQGFVRTYDEYTSGITDYNYYCNPYGTALFQENWTNYALTEWRARFPDRDRNSVTNRVVFPADAVTGVPSQDSRIFVNTNDTTETFYLSGNIYEDLDGNIVSNSVTLEPYRSVILVLRALGEVTGASNAVPVYRLYSYGAAESTYEHLWTTSEAEKNALDSWPSWEYEGIAWYAFTNAESGTTPLYRLYEPNVKQHHYTISATEYCALTNTSWTGEGIQYYVFSEASQAGLYPAYRFYHEALALHHFTISESEKDSIISNPSWGYAYEGIGYYVFATNVTGLVGGPPFAKATGGRSGLNVQDCMAAKRRKMHKKEAAAASLTSNTVRQVNGGRADPSQDRSHTGLGEQESVDTTSVSALNTDLSGLALAKTENCQLTTDLLPVSGDYDGDGSEDIAYYDEPSGQWFIILASDSLDIQSSSSHSLQPAPRSSRRRGAFSLTWGGPGLLPFSIDYDADGISDLGVYDEETLTCFILSLDGSILVWDELE